jgi:hypothetical protein
VTSPFLECSRNECREHHTGHQDELISAWSEPIASLPKDQLVSVHTNWMKRLNWVIKHRGNTTASK